MTLSSRRPGFSSCSISSFPNRNPQANCSDLAADTLGFLSEKREPHSVFLVFILSALTLCGYRPDLRFDREKDIAGFDVETENSQIPRKHAGKKTSTPSTWT